jgi:hypothetical protein
MGKTEFCEEIPVKITTKHIDTAFSQHLRLHGIQKCENREVKMI